MRFGSMAAMGDFWRVIREFNPEGIEREATAPLDLWVVGEPGSGKRTLAGSLLAVDSGANLLEPFRLRDVDYLHGEIPEIGHADLVILVVRMDKNLAELARRASPLVSGVRAPMLLVFTHADQVPSTRDARNAAFRAFSYVSYLKTTFLDAREPGAVREKLVPLLLEALPNLRMPLARQIPTIRAQVAEQVISETCRVNAQFALAANLPANIPFLGGIAGNIADFFVLTKNQVMMVFRLAALYGRDISLSLDVAAEIAPVIGGGLLWRTAARMAVGMLPSLLAVAPKTGIAYVGTYVVGQAARYYYDEGRKPPQELLKEFSSEGSRLYRRMLTGEGAKA